MAMENRQEILKGLEAAIDSGDMRGIDSGLERLVSVEPETIAPEDASLFSARILKLSEEKHPMKHLSKTARVAVVAAAVLLMGVTVYAAVRMNLFSFQSGDKYVSIRTTDSMTAEEAQAFAEENQNAPPPGEGEAVALAEVVPEQTFNSVAEAEAGMDMVIPLPAAMPELELSSAKGQSFFFGEGNEDRTVWLEYGNIESGRMLGLTVAREVLAQGEDITSYTEHDMDDGSLGSYTSKTGVKFSTLTESDETGERTAHIANAMVGEYDYAVVFFGFDEAERQEILDSIDLSAYGA
jgi:uncharacterized Rmd1/YagE family protein